MTNARFFPILFFVVGLLGAIPSFLVLKWILFAGGHFADPEVTRLMTIMCAVFLLASLFLMARAVWGPKHILRKWDEAIEDRKEVSKTMEVNVPANLAGPIRRSISFFIEWITIFIVIIWCYSDESRRRGAITILIFLALRQLAASLTYKIDPTTSFSIEGIFLKRESKLIPAWNKRINLEDYPAFRRKMGINKGHGALILYHRNGRDSIKLPRSRFNFFDLELWALKNLTNLDVNLLEVKRGRV